MEKLTQVYLIRHSEQLKIENKIVRNEESQISNEKIILSDFNVLHFLFYPNLRKWSRIRVSSLRN